MAEKFELHAGGLRVNHLVWLPLLHVSLDVHTSSGTKISVDGFTMGTFVECGEVPKDFLAKFSYIHIHTATRG